MEKSILLVDDELEFCELLQFRLRDCGYKLRSATNGMDALHAARQHLPDVILLDLLLPDMDGLTLCELFRWQLSTRAVPVIMISAVATDVTRHAAKVAGARAYFTKPLELAELKAELKACLAGTRTDLGTEAQRA
jgi:DNA-binding response OmpR family regulator